MTSNEGELDKSGCDEMSEGQHHLDISSEDQPESQGREQQTGNIPMGRVKSMQEVRNILVTKYTKTDVRPVSQQL